MSLLSLKLKVTHGVNTLLGVVRSLMGSLQARAASLVLNTFENAEGSQTILNEFKDNNLLDSASILLTPTSVSNVKIQSIKPNTTAGDFDFTRATTATRVNSSGLIESVASGLPRINFLGGTGKILLEPATTNTATYSNDFSQGDIFGGSGNPSLTGAVLSANQGTAPDGTNTAQKLIDNNDGSSGSVAINFFSTNISSGTDSTFSVFAKKNGANVLRINMTGFDIGRAAFFDLANGTKSGTTQSTIEDYGNGWYRCSVTMNTTTDLVGACLFNVCSDSNQTSVTRDGTQSILLWGMQAEEQSVPTSYLPTSGSSVTRNKDEADTSGDTSIINSTEGVLYCEIAALDDSTTGREIQISDGSVNNRVSMFLGGASNRIRGQVQVGGTSVFNSFTSDFDVKNFNKIAVKYKAQDFGFFINGTQISVNFTQTSIFSADTLNQLNFRRVGAANVFEGKVKTVAVFNEALTSAQLISLTS